MVEILGNAVFVLLIENRCGCIRVTTSAYISSDRVCPCVHICIDNKCLAVGGTIVSAPYLYMWIDVCVRCVSVTPWGGDAGGWR